MHENKQYTQAELARIFAAGLSPEAVNLWPRVELPEAVAMVARAALTEYPDDPYVQEDLANAVRPRCGLRTPWGCIVVEFSEAESDLDVMVTVAGYLDQDPYLELQHLRRDGKVVGLFLSDVAGPMLEDTASSLLAESKLEWQDNGETNQLFELVGFFPAADTGELAGAGAPARHVVGGNERPGGVAGVPAAGASFEYRRPLGSSLVCCHQQLSVGVDLCLKFSGNFTNLYRLSENG